MRREHIEPLHEARPRGRFRMIPRDMNRDGDVTPEQFAAVQRIVLSIFTDMSNSGYSLRETLGAIYLTGAHHAASVLQPTGGD